jgi:hypothetical protein
MLATKSAAVAPAVPAALKCATSIACVVPSATTGRTSKFEPSSSKMNPSVRSVGVPGSGGTGFGSA